MLEKVNSNNTRKKVKNNSFSNNNTIVGSTSNNNRSLLISPKYYKLMDEDIMAFLDLNDLCKVRAVNKMFLDIMHDYYKQRLKIEMRYITSFQKNNKDKNEVFINNIDSQIPISNKNWLDFNLISVTNKIKSLDKSTLIKIKSIKSLGKYSDLIYAPFCIFMGYNVSE